MSYFFIRIEHTSPIITYRRRLRAMHMLFLKRLASPYGALRLRLISIALTCLLNKITFYYRHTALCFKFAVQLQSHE
jgi:hypothetical protein